MKVAVDPGRGLSQRPVLPIRANRGAQLDHEHGRAHAFACHVPQRQVKQAAVIGEVVVVAAHGFARLGSPRQIIAGHARREARQQAGLDLRGHAQPFLQTPLIHACLKQSGGLDLGRSRVGQHGQHLQVGLPKERTIQTCVGVKHADDPHRFARLGRHPERGTDHAVDRLTRQTRLLAQVCFIKGIPGHHRHLSLDSFVYDGLTDPLLDRPPLPIATCFQYGLVAFLVEQHDGGKVGGHDLEDQIQDAIEEHGKWVVHQQTGGGVRQHAHGAALQEKLGHADGTVRDHAGAHDGRPSADHGVFGLVDIRLVGKGQAETNLAISHPDDVVLAQGRLAQNRFAVYQDGFVVTHGDNEELALPRDDFRMSRTNSLTSEQSVPFSVSAQGDAPPRSPCLVRGSWPPYGDARDGLRIDQPSGFFRLSHRSFFLARWFTG